MSAINFFKLAKMKEAVFSEKDIELIVHIRPGVKLATLPQQGESGFNAIVGDIEQLEEEGMVKMPVVISRPSIEDKTVVIVTHLKDVRLEQAYGPFMDLHIYIPEGKYTLEYR